MRIDWNSMYEQVFANKELEQRIVFMIACKEIYCGECTPKNDKMNLGV